MLGILYTLSLNPPKDPAGLVSCDFVGCRNAVSEVQWLDQGDLAIARWKPDGKPGSSPSGMRSGPLCIRLSRRGDKTHVLLSTRLASPAWRTPEVTCHFPILRCYSRPHAAP